MTNNDYFPWDEIQEDNSFPAGCFKFRISGVEDSISSKGNRMFKAQFSCEAPSEFAGMMHFEYYSVGTEENPNGINAGTMGARSFKKLLKAAQVPQGKSIEQILLSLRDSQLLISLNQYVEKDGDFAGEKRNRVMRYDALGTREPMVAPTVVANRPISKPNLPPAPPAPTAPAQAVSSPPAPAPAPPQQEAPPNPTMPGQADAPIPAVNTEPTIPCTVCGESVPASQVGAHLQQHIASQNG